MPLPVKLNVNAEVTPENQASLLKGAARILEPFGLGADLLSDRMALYRLKCLIEITEKAKILLQDNDLDPKIISNKFLSRFIDGASIEDEQDLQLMWANLLAAESLGADNVVFINILKDLTKNSAILLLAIYEKALTDGYDPYEDFIDMTRKGAFFGSSTDDIGTRPNMFFISGSTASKNGKKTIEAKKNFENLSGLRNLGLIEVETFKSGHGVNQYSYSTYAKITPLGFRFVNTCTQFGDGND